MQQMYSWFSENSKHRAFFDNQAEDVASSRCLFIIFTIPQGPWMTAQYGTWNGSKGPFYEESPRISLKLGFKESAWRQGALPLFYLLGFQHWTRRWLNLTKGSAKKLIHLPFCVTIISQLGKFTMWYLLEIFNNTWILVEYYVPYNSPVTKRHFNFPRPTLSSIWLIDFRDVHC